MSIQKIIDVLKVDVEGAEWPCFVDWLKTGILKNVKQIAIEVHTPKLRAAYEIMSIEDYLRTAWILEELQRQGFRKYLVDYSGGCCKRFSNWTRCCGRFSNWSRISGHIICCYEIFFIKIPIV